MKIPNSHKIISTILALLMFCTSIGFTADLHFCKGDLKSFNLFGKAESCHSSKKKCKHHQSKKQVEKTEKDCCANKTILIDDLDADFNLSQINILADIQLEFAVAYVLSFLPPVPSTVIQIRTADQIDPLPPVDIYVLLDHFLI